MEYLIYIFYMMLFIFFIAYNIISFYKKKIIFSINCKDKEIYILNDEFFKLQLYFSIINSSILIILSIIFINFFYKYVLMYISFCIFIFLIINYLIKIISLNKKYIKIQ